MPVIPQKLAFNAGELSPTLDARFDLDKYRFGCKELKNWWPMTEGPLKTRPNTLYAAQTKDQANPSRLEPFIYSETTSFVLEIGANHIRFISNYLEVDWGGTPNNWLQGTAYTRGTYVLPPLWVTGKLYLKGMIVQVSGSSYKCVTDPSHTSGVWATDLAAGYWVQLEARTFYCVSAHTSSNTGAGNEHVDFFADIANWLNTARMEVPTDYSASEIFDIDIEQINDVVYFTHPDYPEMKLTRLADDDWTFAEVDYTYPPFLPVNTSSDTLSCSHVSGSGRTLTSSVARFYAEHVGSYWELKHQVPGSSVSKQLTSNSPTTGLVKGTHYLEIEGDWSVRTAERWKGSVEVARCPLDKDPALYSNYEVIRTFSSDANSNVSATGVQEDRAYIGLFFKNYATPWASTNWWDNAGADTAPPVTKEPKPYAYLESDEAYFGGYVKVTAVGGAGPLTTCTVEVKEQLYAAAVATEVWREGAFSEYRGYARTVTFFEGRRVLGGHLEEPKGVYGSQSDDYDNFEYNTLDTGAWNYNILGQRNPIQWMTEADGRLYIGTTGGEAVLGGSSAEEPITPTSVKARSNTRRGSAKIKAHNIDDVVIFVQNGKKFVREMLYDWQKEGFTTNDLTRLARHICGDGIVDTSFTVNPYTNWLGVREDGELIMLLLERAEGVASWYRTTINGLIESVCTIPKSDGTDEIWIQTKRTIGGSQEVVRYIEYFGSHDFTGDRHTDCRLDLAWTDNSPEPSVTEVRPLSLTSVTDPTKTFYYWQVTAPLHGLTTGDKVRLNDVTQPIIHMKPCRVVVKDANVVYLVHWDSGEDRSITSCAQASEPLIGVSPFTQEFPQLVFIDGVVGMVELNGTVQMLRYDTPTANTGTRLETTDSTAYTAYSSGGTVYRNVVDPPTASTPVTGNLGAKLEVLKDTVLGLSIFRNGQIVSAIIDGVLYEDLVIAGGNLALPVWGHNVRVGLSFECSLQTQKIEIPMDLGTTRNRELNLVKIGMSLQDGWGLKAGMDENKLQEVQKATGIALDTAPAPFDADKEYDVWAEGNTKKGLRLIVKQDKPWPATLLGLYPTIEPGSR